MATKNELTGSADGRTKVDGKAIAAADTQSESLLPYSSSSASRAPDCHLDVAGAIPALGSEYQSSSSQFVFNLRAHRLIGKTPGNQEPEMNAGSNPEAPANLSVQYGVTYKLGMGSNEAELSLTKAQQVKILPRSQEKDRSIRSRWSRSGETGAGNRKPVICGRGNNLGLTLVRQTTRTASPLNAPAESGRGAFLSNRLELQDIVSGLANQKRFS